MRDPTGVRISLEGSELLFSSWTLSKTEVLLIFVLFLPYGKNSGPFSFSLKYFSYYITDRLWKTHCGFGEEIFIVQDNVQLIIED